MWGFLRHRKPLTRREGQVLKYIVSGQTNKEIALKLNIAEQTVKNHAEHIYLKLRVRNRVQATTYAIRKGWF